MSEATKFFQKGGPLAAAMGRFEARPAQISMTRAVEKVIKNEGVLLAEAGTGTGKTLAYLVPSMTSDKKVIISTGTKNLQEQIYFKDIELLVGKLNIKCNVAYLKGQNNYLCQTRLDRFLRSPRVLAHSPGKVTQLKNWSETTLSGDRMELSGFKDDSTLWMEVCSTRETRIGSNCPYHDQCYVTQARLKAFRAQIVIVNHHLYFADLATKLKGGSILPKHDVVIFDEAHMIEDIATEFFSINTSSGRVDRLVKDTRAIIKSAALRDDPNESRRPKLLAHTKSQAQTFFELFRGQPGRTNLNLAQKDDIIVDAYHRLDTSLEAIEMSLNALEGRNQAIDHCAGRFNAIRTDLAAIMEARDKKYVYWVDTKPRTITLGASPIDISEAFKEGVLFSIPSVILTSATLSTGGEFKFLRSRLGIDFDVSELSLDAPFNYQKQACLYIPSHMPDPRDPAFIISAADEILKLIKLSSGGALVLCTSNKNMKQIHSFLKTDIPGPLLLQGTAPKTNLLSQFQDDPSSVLVATTSFWQGVDLPGDALRLVIIDKLPFTSPSDPIIAARIEKLREENKNPFMNYQVPQAALSLKQGFGRLIRTNYDRGIVAILDSRLNHMRYAGVFLRSLPPCPRASNFDFVKTWWNSKDQPAPEEIS